MIVYDVRLSRAVVAVSSRLHPQLSRRPHQAVRGLMLTSGPVKLMVCVDRGRVIIWRLQLQNRDKQNARDKYLDDDAPADDEDCDVDCYLYDDNTDDVQQVRASRVA